MRQIALALTFVTIALIATACTETATPTNTATRTAAPSPAAPAAASPVDELATARANYEKNCAACHGEEGVGGLVKVEEKQIKVPSLKGAGVIKHTDEQLAKTITNGEEAMPAFKDKLSAAEITELVRFVRKEFHGK